MPTAVVLLKVNHAKVTGTAETILKMPDVTEVYSVSGRYDLLVIIKCQDVEKIETVITDHLLKTDGIIDSETMFAFRALDKKEAGESIDVD
ncbi:MAG TPA: Lrp/AsnC ligand binding domain-containing protein [Opitutaceae bacterium]|nr:Lrp/AsnC ligand binding domain-containing protein [Opitutaceae bacterium]